MNTGILLIPQPRNCRVGTPSQPFDDAQWILFDPSFGSRIRKTLLNCAADYSGRFANGLVVSAGDPAQGRVLLRLTKITGMNPQAYTLTGNAKGFVIKASDDGGAFYGIQTFIQLLRQCGSALPPVVIRDHPDFERRGYMLDISRCKVPSMETLKYLVDYLAHIKINELQLYTEHTFAFSGHETVWHDASPMTAGEILELQAYCEDRFIELVPNLNSFGHFERWLRHPRYRVFAESPDGFIDHSGRKTSFGTVLKPNPQSLDLIDSLYREFLPNFNSGFVNVGCDETWELGKGWSKPLCDKNGVTEVYLSFLKQIDKRVKSHGKKMMFWGDIILHKPELINALPRDVIALEWGYEATHPFARDCKLFKDSSVPFYVCPGTSSWGSLIGRSANCLGNLASAAKNGSRFGAVGYLITDWGDNGHHQYLPASYLGLTAGAAYSWCYRSNSGIDIAAALDQHVFFDAAGVLGTVCRDIGNAYTQLPDKAVNGTIFNRLFFWNFDGKLPTQSTGKQLKAVRSMLQNLRERVTTAKPQRHDGDLIVREIRNNILMAIHGIDRALLYKKETCAVDPALSDIQHILSEHEQLWLARNRPGGLHESSDFIRQRIEALVARREGEGQSRLPTLRQ